MKPSTAREATDSPIGFPIVLNDRWRVSEDRTQWILERLTGRSWENRAHVRAKRFHRCQAALLRSIRKLCGDVDHEALARVQALPQTHPEPDRPSPARRNVLKGGLALLGAAAALTGMTRAARAEPIEWTVADDGFRQWFFFKGDTVTLSPTAEPMRESGLYAEPAGDGFRLVFVTVAVTWSGRPTGHAFRSHEQFGPSGEPFDRLAPDAPRGHRILSHRPRYWLGPS